MSIDPVDLQKATVSVLSCVVSELTKSGHIDLGALTENIQGTATEHRKSGDHNMADAMHALSEYLMKTVKEQSVRPAKDQP